MYLLRTALLFIATALGTSVNSGVVSDCSVNPLFQITSLSLSPEIPVIGENTTLFSNYHVPSEITAGNTKYSCIYNGIPVISETDDLCTQTSCPITVGDHADKSVITIPDVKGKLSCTIKWLDAAEKELMCIKTVFQLGTLLRGSSASSAFRIKSIPLYYVEEDTTMTVYIPPSYRNHSSAAVEFCENNEEL
jgi:hypothetical protein